MSTAPITTLELRSVLIPQHWIIDWAERETGKIISHETRHFLAGQPVHCGDILELYRDGQWVQGRYEWQPASDGGLPTLESQDKTFWLDSTMLMRWP